MSKADHWFVTFNKQKSPILRLFCFHYAGGSASIFRQWSKDIIKEVEVVAIQLPGREERFDEPQLSNICEVIDNLCLNFADYTNKPFIFFGHSIGAMIAFEFTRALRKHSMLQPKHLIISGAKAPQVPITKSPIHSLPTVKFIEELKKYNGTPDHIINDEEMMSIFIPTLRADFCVAETYKYIGEEPFNHPITAFGGLNDDTFDSQNLQKWQTQTTSSFESYFFPGDHFFINSSYDKVIKIVNFILQNYLK